MLRVIGLVAAVLAFRCARRVFRRRPERIACLVMFVLQVGLFALWLSGMLAVSLGGGRSWLPGGAVLDPRVQRTFETVCLWIVGLSAAVFPMAPVVRAIQWASGVLRETQTGPDEDSETNGDPPARERDARTLAESCRVLVSAAATWLKSRIHRSPPDQEMDVPVIKTLVLAVVLELTALGAIHILHSLCLPGFEESPIRATSPDGSREVLLLRVSTPDHSFSSRLLLHKERGRLLCRPGGLFHYGHDSASGRIDDATCVWSGDSRRVQVWVRLDSLKPEFVCVFHVDCAQNRLLPLPAEHGGLAQLTAAFSSESE